MSSLSVMQLVGIGMIIMLTALFAGLWLVYCVVKCILPEAYKLWREIEKDKIAPDKAPETAPKGETDLNLIKLDHKAKAERSERNG